MNSLHTIAGVIKSGHSFLLCGHIMPDGDSLGSMLALGRVLKDMGKQVTMVSFDPVPDNLTFLPGIDGVCTGIQEFTRDFDVFMMLDCSSPDRLGPYHQMLERDLITVNIDHHPGNTIRARYAHVDSQAAATGEIIYDMLQYLGVNITTGVAACLYTAIITDTGSFRYENTTPATHRRVADLMECGIGPAQLNELIYDQKPLPAILLLRAALQTMQFTPCKRVAWISVLRETLIKAGARDQHTEGIINYPRSVQGVKIAILFRELEPGVFKVGFRSKGDIDVNRLASVFGGGGHVRASGATIEGKYEDICNAVVSEAVSLLSDGEGVLSEL